MRKLLVVVDMQNDFVDGALGTKEACNIVDNVNEKVYKALLNGEDVVFTKDTHYDNYLETQEGMNLPIMHCIYKSYGWELIPSLRKYEMSCPVFEKLTFGSLDLAYYVSNNNYEEVELIGLCTDICVISNALIIKATNPELIVTVDSRCCAGVSIESHENALNAMNMCQINII